MAIAFNDSNGKAKSRATWFKFEDGLNTFRIVGGIVAKYDYWVKTLDNKKTSIECLGFNRETEQFDNIETDWVRHYFPEIKCSWAYNMQVIDRKDGKLKLMPMKKKLFEQIKKTAAKLGDPTDGENGWDCVVTREKTGSEAFNVEYTLDVLDLVNSPLSDEDSALLVDIKPIDELVKRQTSAEQKEFMESKVVNTGAGNDDPDAIGEFDKPEGNDFDSDVPQ